MNFSTDLVASLLDGGMPAFKLAVEKGVRPDYVSGEGKKALEFVFDYVKEYRALPSREIIAGKLDIFLEPAQGTAEFCIDECLKIRLHKVLKEGLGPVSDFLEREEPGKALDKLRALL